MKKITAILLTLCLASVTLFGFSCGGEKTNDGLLEEPTETSLDKILSSAEQPTEFSYDMIITNTNGTEMASKFYMKDTKIRQESAILGQKTIMLGDSKGVMYTYNPVQNTAMKMNFQESMEGDELEQDPYNILNEISESVTLLGYEYIDEKRCAVVEYTISEDSITFTQKMWIWERYGMPIKIETTANEETSTIEYKNIETSGVDDSLFELPEGVTVTDLDSLMQGNLDSAALEALQNMGQ
jgi:outer membrane lipoprotein-sorting protein